MLNIYSTWRDLENSIPNCHPSFLLPTRYNRCLKALDQFYSRCKRVRAMSLRPSDVTDEDDNVATKRSSLQESRDSFHQPSMLRTALESSHEDMSLIYLAEGTRSRASAYPVMKREEDLSTFDGPDHYLKQGYPIIAPPEPPPVSEPEPAKIQPEETPWYQSPLEYIFGGNNDDDDDVSTIYGDYDEPPVRTARAPSNAPRSGPVVETVYEEEEESSTANNGSSVDDRSRASSRGSLAYKAHSSETTSSNTGSRSKSSSNLDASMARGKQSLKADASMQQNPWSQGESDGIMKIASARDASSRSWQMTRSTNLSKSTRRSSSRSTTSGSVLPINPQVIEFRKGGPMLTMGMSGRAVLHVNMEHSNDGTIRSLEYTTPLVPGIEFGHDSDGHLSRLLNDGTGRIGSNEFVSWYDYYYYRNKLLRLCHSRQCFRVNALLILCFAMIVTVGFSITEILGGSRNSVPPTQSPNGKPNGKPDGSLSDLQPPPAFAVTVPSVIDKNIDDWFHKDGSYSFNKDTVPFFFHVPMAGALIAVDNWGGCLGFTIASDVGRVEANESKLKSIQVFGRSFINVDTTSVKGIARAKKLNLVPSGLPDVIISPLFFQVVQELYSKQRTAKLIVTLRHPVQRVVALYNYITKIPGANPKLAKMSLDEYVLSKYIENNYMTRLLTNKPGGTLTSQDLNLAKEILRRKAIVGLYEELEKSIEHINKYFSWTPLSPNAIQCQTRSITEDLKKEMQPQLDAGSTAYMLIINQNQFDLRLFEYASVVLLPYQHEALARQMAQATS